MICNLSAAPVSSPNSVRNSKHTTFAFRNFLKEANPPKTPNILGETHTLLTDFKHSKNSWNSLFRDEKKARIVSDIDLNSLELFDYSDEINRPLVAKTHSFSGISELLSPPMMKKTAFQHISELKYDPKGEVVVGREIWNKREDGSLLKYTPEHVNFHENYMNICAGERITTKDGFTSSRYSVIITVFRGERNYARKLYKSLKDHYLIWYDVKQNDDLANLAKIHHQDIEKLYGSQIPKGRLIYSDDEAMILIGPRSVYYSTR